MKAIVYISFYLLAVIGIPFSASLGNESSSFENEVKNYWEKIHYDYFKTGNVEEAMKGYDENATFWNNNKSLANGKEELLAYYNDLYSEYGIREVKILAYKEIKQFKKTGYVILDYRKRYESEDRGTIFIEKGATIIYKKVDGKWLIQSVVIYGPEP